MKSTVAALQRNGSSPALLANQPMSANRITPVRGPMMTSPAAANTTSPFRSSNLTSSSLAQPSYNVVRSSGGSSLYSGTLTPSATPTGSGSLRELSTASRHQQQTGSPNTSVTISVDNVPDTPHKTSAVEKEQQQQRQQQRQTSTTIPRLIVDDEEIPPSNCFRLVLLGSARVGKTSIVSRFLGSKFNDAYTPTIEDFHRKFYRIRGETYRLDILDTSGNDPFPAMRRLSLLTGDLFLLVYSVDSRESFDEARRLQEQVYTAKAGQQRPIGPSQTGGAGSAGRSPLLAKPSRQSGSGKHSVIPSVPMVIVGNKIDRETERVVDSTELQTVADIYSGSCAGVEVSAKKNYNVDEIFVKLFQLARLPTEMSPSQHRKIQPSTYLGVPGDEASSSSAVHRGGTSSGNSGGAGSGSNSETSSIGSAGSGISPRSVRRRMVSLRRRLSDACGAVAINARRPSIRTDLLTLQQSRRTLTSLGSASTTSQLDPSGSDSAVGGGIDIAAKCNIQ